ncbi:MAG: VWA domain-containing protein [Candidatus Yanofskybacteria bacterium]|nr:VWA domain-containing protein [Candidatus Yanofskybacteria bacterium]
MSEALAKFTDGNGKSLTRLTQEEKNKLSSVRNRLSLRDRQINQIKGPHLGLIFDATESMGTYWENTQKNIRKLHRRLQELIPGLLISFIAYRDYDDGNLIIETLKKGESLQQIEAFLSRIRCIGGGDPPEAVEVALKTALDTDINFGILLGDSEPHGFVDSFGIPGFYYHRDLHPQPLENFRKVAEQLNKKGVPIYTVATHNGEILASAFKEIAQITQGKFFLMERIDDLIDIFSTIVAKKVSRVSALKSILEKEQGGRLTDNQMKLLTS